MSVPNIRKNKIFISVLTACLILVVGVSAVIYNYSLPKTTLNSQGNSTTIISFKSSSTRKSEAANVPATGIPKPSTTTKPTVAKEERAYTGSFSTPTNGKVIKDYSNGEMVKSKTMGDWRVHDGVDFNGKEGSSVFAVQNSTVSAVDTDVMWGNTITLTCPDGLIVKYCGLSDNIRLKKGDKVSKGATIGEIGMLPIESAAESHVHVECYIDGKTVSPLKALNLI